MMISQPRLVRLLVKRARELGVDIRWGHEVVDLGDGTDEVAVTVAAADGDHRLGARYLVGADGGRSVVRKLAGIAFPGHTSDTVARIAHVRMPDELRAPDGGIEVPGFGTLRFGHTRLDRGGMVYADLQPGEPLLGTIEFGSDAGVSADESEPMTLPELRESMRRVLGVELPFEPPGGDGPHALRRIAGQNTRQADRYRAGRVLLLGDAAHVHSAMGGPGLNLGLQDAMNLGWKLAATAKGEAPHGLLATYHSERHPVGRRVMMQSMSQTALFAPGAEIGALRELFAELLADCRKSPGTSPDCWPEPMCATTSATRIRCPGTSCRTSLSTTAAASPSCSTKRVRCSLDLSAVRWRPPRPHGPSGWTSSMRSRVDAPAAMLIRPDGYVAWAADGFGDGASTTRWTSALVRLGSAQRRAHAHRDVRQRQPGGVGQRRMGGEQLAHRSSVRRAHLAPAR